MNSSSLYVRALYPITNTISRTAPSAGVMAVAFSAWFGTRTVGSPEYWVFFAWFGAWLAAVSLFAVASSLQEAMAPGSVTTDHYVVLALSCALMGWRAGSSIQYLPEFFIATVVVVGLLALRMLGREKDRAAVKAGFRTDSDTARERAGKGSLQYPAQRPRYSFNDVVGMQETKERLSSAGREITKPGSKTERNGVLLFGPPGNGKTFMAEALAGELRLPFISVSVGNIASKWVNDTPGIITQVFADAAAQAPCLLFIDEVDSLASKRDSGTTHQEDQKATNALLTSLVDIRRHGVVVVAATNFIDQLDTAFAREGRFDFKVEVTSPDEPARRHLIKSRSQKPISAETVDIAVKRWAGFSVSRIAAILAEANRASEPVLTFDGLMKALRRVQGRQARLPEDTPSLAQLTLGADHRKQLEGLGNRMIHIMEIEAMGGSVPRGAVFFGPPGTGKSLAARALAKSTGWAFISVSGMDLLADAKKMDAIAAQASDLRPCIVFIDEADDVFKSRRFSSNAPLTNKMLAIMDGSAGQVPDVLFVAATNHIEDMDPAALRGGRFTEKIEFGLPDRMTVQAFVQKWMQSTKAVLAADLTAAAIAPLLEGQPFANLDNILQMAVNCAISRSHGVLPSVVVTMEDLRSAISTVVLDQH